MGVAAALGIELSWAERQTYSDLLVQIVATGEANGAEWDYHQMRFKEPKKK